MAPNKRASWKEFSGGVVMVSGFSGHDTAIVGYMILCFELRSGISDLPLITLCFAEGINIRNEIHTAICSIGKI